MNKLIVRDLNVKGKRVFVRVDFNVPLNEKGEITDITRIKATLPTLTYLIFNGAKLIITSHLGRPKGKFKPELSLKPVQKKLSEFLGKEVVLAPEVVGDEVEKLKNSLKEGEILLLENVRFHPGETEYDDNFARELAKGIDIYVNDAFGACHRAHASVVGITKFIPIKAAGFLLEKEIKYLGKVLYAQEKPFTLILGGAKVSDKIPVILNMIDKVDHLLIGGAMAFTFLKAMGKDVGKSIIDEEKLKTAGEIIKEVERRNIDFHLPKDFLAAEKIEKGVTAKIIKDEPIPENHMGLDIGSETIEVYSKIISKSKMIFWNGPMGVFEIDEFSKGTISIAQAVAYSKAISIVGGGDSVAALEKAGVKDKITHVSTGGGASLEFLAKGTLPGVEVLDEVK
jgi:phosphoglycerate kinase